MGRSSGVDEGSAVIWHQDSSGVPGVTESGDYFGAAVAAGDVNNDGFDDLIVGAPGEAIGSIDNAGLVTVIYGSRNGLRGTGSVHFHQDSSNVPGMVEAGDVLGMALAVGDYNEDGIDDVAAGAPGEAVGSLNDAGAVNVFYGSRSGLSASGSQIWDQNSTSVPGVAEAGDRFGASLASGDFNGDSCDDLAVGVPGEAIGSLTDAGAVNVIYGRGTGLTGSGSQGWDQNSSGILGVSEVGDRFGTSLASGDLDDDGYDDLVVGVPGEAIGSLRRAGLVHVFYGRFGGLHSSRDTHIHQDTASVPGVVEREDRFGMTVATGRVNSDRFDDVLVGAPGEAIGTRNDAGGVWVLDGRAGAITGASSQLFTQNSPSVPGGSEREDRMGNSLACGDFDNDGRADVLVHTPGEDVGSTASADYSTAMFGTNTGLTGTGSQDIFD